MYHTGLLHFIVSQYQSFEVEPQDPKNPHSYWQFKSKFLKGIRGSQQLGTMTKEQLCNFDHFFSLSDDAYNLYLQTHAINPLNRRKEAVGFYKIHLMPKKQDVLIILNLIMQSLEENIEFQNLIYKFKVTPSFEELDDAYGEKLPIIVIYPAWGQENVQKLVNKLCILFRNFTGLGKEPRYNTEIKNSNGLIFYAQADAMDKNKHRAELNQFFDGSTNFALYRPDFEDIAYIAKEDVVAWAEPYIHFINNQNPYALYSLKL